MNFDWWLFHIFFNLVHFLILAISHFFIFSFAQKYILCLYLCNFNPVCAKTILTAVLNCLLYIVLPSYVVLVVVMVGNALCSLIMWWLSVVITPFCRFQKWVRFRDTSRGGHHFWIFSSLSRTMRATLFVKPASLSSPNFMSWWCDFVKQLTRFLLLPLIEFVVLKGCCLQDMGKGVWRRGRDQNSKTWVGQIF